MALTKNQRNIIKRANARLSRILDKVAMNEPSLLYAPAVEDALNALGGRIRFTADDLQAAKSFNRKKTSTVTGARTWAAERGLKPMPPAQPAALTATQRREIDTANKRLAAMRKRGDDIPERYKNIDRFRKNTAQLAHEFIQNPKTVKQPRRPYRKLPAALGQRVKQLADAFRIKMQGDAYYSAVNSGELEQGTQFNEFTQQATAPEFSGLDLENWVRDNAPRTYDEILRMRGTGATENGDYWEIIRGMNFK